MRLVIIEDSVEDIEFLQYAFGQIPEADIELKFFETGRGAIEYFGNETLNHPDLVILDLRLPDISGFDVLKAIKTNHDTKQIPVVIFSTSRLQDDIRTSYQHHANSYIQKPNDLSTLIKTINGVYCYWGRVVSLAKALA